MALRVIDDPDPADELSRVRAALRQADAELATARVELERQQEFAAALLDTIDVGIVSCDAEGASITSNRAARGHAGTLGTGTSVPREEMPGVLDAFDKRGRRVAPEDYPLMRALRGEDVGSVEMLLGPVGGPHQEFLTYSAQIVGPRGDVLGAVSALTNISTERAADRALGDAQRLGQLGSFTYDMVDGSVTFSEQMLQVWGLAADADIAEAAAKMIHSDDLAAVREVWRRVLEEGGHARYEHRIVRQDGEVRHLRTDIEQVPDVDGLPGTIRGTEMDVTELVLAERSAQRANDFFDAVLAASPDYMFVVDVASGVVRYNSRSTDFLGRNAEQVAAMSHSEQMAIRHPGDEVRRRGSDIAAALLSDGQVLELRYRGLHTDGRWRWLSRRVTPFRRDTDGTILEVLSVVRDVTDVVEAEDLIAEADTVRRAAEARFVTVFEQAGIGGVIVGLDGVPTRVNPAACALLGRPVEELVGHLWTGYCHPDESPLVDVVLATVAAGEDTYADERRYVRPDGAVVWASTHVTMVRDEAGEPDYLIAQLADITKRKKLEQELTERALHDSLTGLPNRALLTDRLVHALAGSRRRGAQLGVMLVDLDSMWAVNDSLGDALAEALLRQVAARISAVIRPGDTVARFCDDQFVIVCDDVSAVEIEQIAGRVLDSVSQPCLLDGEEVSVTASLGIVLADEASTPESLLRGADTAMHRARHHGGGRLEFL